MTDAKHHIEQMIAECECIVDGEYGDETQAYIDAFMDEMRGFKFPLFCTQSSDLPSDRTIKGMRRAKGWLIANMATLTSQTGDTTTISTTAQASASASVEVTMSQVFGELESLVHDDSELSEIKAAVADLEAAKGKSPETICDKTSKLLDLAKKGADVAKAVGPYIAMALQGMG